MILSGIPVAFSAASAAGAVSSALPASGDACGLHHTVQRCVRHGRGWHRGAHAARSRKNARHAGGRYA
jgi:hypothetical protein